MGVYRQTTDRQTTYHDNSRTLQRNCNVRLKNYTWHIQCKESLAVRVNCNEQDIKYDMEDDGPVPLGSEFKVIVKAQNTSRFERTVNLTLTLFSVYYTGVTKRKLRSEIFNFNLCSLRRQ